MSLDLRKYGLKLYGPSARKKKRKSLAEFGLRPLHDGHQLDRPASMMPPQPQGHVGQMPDLSQSLVDPSAAIIPPAPGPMLPPQPPYMPDFEAPGMGVTPGPIQGPGLNQPTSQVFDQGNFPVTRSALGYRIEDDPAFQEQAARQRAALPLSPVGQAIQEANRQDFIDSHGLSHQQGPLAGVGGAHSDQLPGLQETPQDQPFQAVGTAEGVAAIESARQRKLALDDYHRRQDQGGLLNSAVDNPVVRGINDAGYEVASTVIENALRIAGKGGAPGQEAVADMLTRARRGDQQAQAAIDSEQGTFAGLVHQSVAMIGEFGGVGAATGGVGGAAYLFGKVYNDRVSQRHFTGGKNELYALSHATFDTLLWTLGGKLIEGATGATFARFGGNKFLNEAEHAAIRSWKAATAAGDVAGAAEAESAFAVAHATSEAASKTWGGFMKRFVGGSSIATVQGALDMLGGHYGDYLAGVEKHALPDNPGKELLNSAIPLIVGHAAAMAEQGVKTKAYEAAAKEFLENPTGRAAQEAGVTPSVAPTQKARQRLADQARKAYAATKAELAATGGALKRMPGEMVRDTAGLAKDVAAGLKSFGEPKDADAVQAPVEPPVASQPMVAPEQPEYAGTPPEATQEPTEAMAPPQWYKALAAKGVTREQAAKMTASEAASVIKGTTEAAAGVPDQSSQESSVAPTEAPAAVPPAAPGTSAVQPEHRIVQAAEPYRDFLGNNEAPGDGWAEEANYKDSVEAEINAIARPEGWHVTKSHDASSTYWDVERLGPGGDTTDSFQVRASNHKQRYGGSIWSFEPGDDAKSVRQGLDKIAARVRPTEAIPAGTTGSTPGAAAGSLAGLQTSSGRDIGSPPKKGGNQWLVNQAIAEAEATGDTPMAEQAKALRNKRLSKDDKELLNDYLSSGKEVAKPAEDAQPEPVGPPAVKPTMAERVKGRKGEEFGRLEQQLRKAATTPEEGDAVVKMHQAVVDSLGIDPDEYAKGLPLVEKTDVSKSAAVRGKKLREEQGVEGPLGPEITGKVIRGEYSPLKDGRAIIRVFENAQNLATLLHESGHHWRRLLEQYRPEDHALAAEWAGAKKQEDGSYKWDRPAEEKFTRGLERYMRDGKAPTPKLTEVFERFRQWLTETYKAIKGSPIDVQISPEMRGVYDRLLGAEGKPAEPDLAGLPGPIAAIANQIIAEGSELPKFHDARKATLSWSARSQRSVGQIKALGKFVEGVVPDPVRREAITNWIQADGDVTELGKRAAASSKKLRPAYEAAMNLTPEELAVAQKAKDTFHQLLTEARKYGISINELPNYVTQIWKSSVFGGFAASKNRRLSGSVRFARERFYDSYFHGEQAGLVPENKDIARLLPIYMNEVNNAINSRRFVQELSQGKAADGRPLLAPTGTGRLMENKKTGDQVHLVFPDHKADEALDYKPMSNQPALRDWRWAGTAEDGTPIMVKGDLLVHPDFADHLDNVLSDSPLRKWYRSPSESILQTIPKRAVKFLADDVQQVMKATMLGSMSPFHMVQEGTHGYFHRINPLFGFERIDLEGNAGQFDAASHGLMLNHDRISAQQFREGLDGSTKNLLSWGVGKLGKPGAYVRKNVIDAYQNWLFEQYIPGLKYKTYEHMLQRNKGVFAKELASGKATEAQVKYISATQANAAYGHLNYADLGRSPLIQHLLQMSLLAPDFLEARGRFLGQSVVGAASKVHREQFKAMLLGGAALYAGARILNKVLDDDWHWKEPFSVVVGNRKYRIRSVPDDAYRALGFIWGNWDDTRKFAYGRLSPLLARGAVEGLSGVNYRGEPTTLGETLTNLTVGSIPLMLQPITRGLTETTRDNPVSPLEQLWGSFGVSISRYSPLNDVYNLSHKWIEQHGSDYGIEPSRTVYPRSKYQKLRFALEDDDQDEAMAQIDKLLAQEKVEPKELYDRVRQSFTQPFTGSTKTDAIFRKSLSAEDQQLFDAAQARRDNLVDRVSMISKAVDTIATGYATTWLVGPGYPQQKDVKDGRPFEERLAEYQAARSQAEAWMLEHKDNPQVQAAKAAVTASKDYRNRVQVRSRPTQGETETSGHFNKRVSVYNAKAQRAKQAREAAAALR